jgi:hypothetical protein
VGGSTDLSSVTSRLGAQIRLSACIGIWVCSFLAAGAPSKIIGREHMSGVLERRVGATPQEFESLILRSCDPAATGGRNGQNTVHGGRGRRHDRRVTGDPEPDAAQHPPDDDQARATARRSGDPRYGRRNLANRLSPGPSGAMSRQRADKIGRLLRSLDSGTPPTAWADQQARTRTSGDRSRPADRGRSSQPRSNAG